MKRYAAIAGMVVCFLGVSSTAQASTHHPKGITTASAAKQYLADIAPANAAATTAHNQAKGAATVADLAKAVAPVIVSYNKFDSLLLRQRWPSGVKTDIHTLVVADSAYIGDLNAVSNASAVNLSALGATISRDGQITEADSNIVRSDLGLPPPTNP
jgi:hypothetical protein